MGELAIEQGALGWSLLALSTFVTLLPIWLGITVLLNGERRTWGLWLAGGSLIVAGGFFASHTAMVDGSLLPFPVNPALWFIGWTVIVLLPLAWYVVLLWFGGYWENRASSLRRIHRFALQLACGLALASIIAVVPFEGIPGGGSRWASSIPSSPIVRTPLATIVFPLFLFVTIALALDTLRRPPVTGSAGVDSARRRARPQLIATTLLLLAVTMLASVALARTAGQAPGRLDADAVRLLQWLDLAIVALIAGAIITLGRAIVSYEIFTGKTLPRRGLQRHLRNAIALAAAAGVVVAASRYAPIDRTTVLLLGGIGLMGFYALVNWRSYAERQRFLEQLRPHPEPTTSSDDEFGPSLSTLRAQFDLLCANVLECSRAALVTYAPTSPLEAEALAYPSGAGVPPSLPSREMLASMGDALSQPIDPARNDGFALCIPLWGRLGIDGALLLGEKVNGGIYSQEEIEVARATAEQLASLAANVGLARRLIELQRRRIADRVLIDSQTRRILHDEVLPAIHALLLSSAADDRAGETLVDVHRRISDILRSIPPGTPRALAELGLVGAIRHMVEAEHRTAFDTIDWRVADEAVVAAKELRAERSEVLFYAAQETLRNAARHARGGRHDRRVHLTIAADIAGGFTLLIEDDGVGVEGSIARGDGAGQGLELHGTLLAAVGGVLAVDSRAGRGTRVTLRVPFG